MDECKFPVLFLVFFNFAQNAFLQFIFGFCATDFFSCCSICGLGRCIGDSYHFFSAANKAIMSLKRHYNLLSLSAIYLLFSGTDNRRYVNNSSLLL